MSLHEIRKKEINGNASRKWLCLSACLCCMRLHLHLYWEGGGVVLVFNKGRKRRVVTRGWRGVHCSRQEMGLGLGVPCPTQHTSKGLMAASVDGTLKIKNFA